mmetsp:Transcript_33285/g.107676  ORF Transcript_33285/g.107676 Transcript_33285/m.107676 type:complete len:314 (-) Transcript_33285:821-1762(-)
MDKCTSEGATWKPEPPPHTELGSPRLTPQGGLRIFSLCPFPQLGRKAGTRLALPTDAKHLLVRADQLVELGLLLGLGRHAPALAPFHLAAAAAPLRPAQDLIQLENLVHSLPPRRVSLGERPCRHWSRLGHGCLLGRRALARRRPGRSSRFSLWRRDGDTLGSWRDGLVRGSEAGGTHHGRLGGGWRLPGGRRCGYHSSRTCTELARRVRRSARRRRLARSRLRAGQPSVLVDFKLLDRVDRKLDQQQPPLTAVRLECARVVGETLERGQRVLVRPKLHKAKPARPGLAPPVASRLVPYDLGLLHHPLAAALG